MALYDNLIAVFEQINLSLNREQVLKYKEEFKKRIEAKTQELKTVANEAVAKCSAEKRQLDMTLLGLEPFFKYIETGTDVDATINRPLSAWCMDWLLSTWSENLERNKQHLLMVELAQFMRLLASDNLDMAKNYYLSNQEVLDKASSAVTRLMEEHIKQPVPEIVKSLQDWQADFELALKGQINSPQAILPLIIHYYDQPQAFAALLLWLIEQKVSAQTILHSGVLHQFFDGYSGFLAADSHCLFQVYDTLKTAQNPEAKTLYAMAKTTSAYVTGSPNQQKQIALQSYALTGENSVENASSLIKLAATALKYPQADISPDPDNIRQLSTWFAATFLRLLANAPDVAKQLTQEQWQQYFAQKLDELGDELTSLAEWFDLHTLLKRHGSDAAQLAYTKIIDIAVVSWLQIDMDWQLINKIKSLNDNPSRHEILKNKYLELMQPYLQILAALTAPLTQEGYLDIEDVWKHSKPSLDALKRFSKSKLELAYPKTIYELQVRVLQECNQLTNTINFEQVLGVMLSPLCSKEEAKAHEKRLLVEWLSVETQKVNQDFIMDRLSKLQPAEALWSQPCGKKNLFIMAAKNGNLSLITQLLADESSTPDSDTLIDALIASSSKGKIEVAHLLLGFKGANSLTEKDVAKAFSSATFHGKFGAVKFLLELKDEKRVQKIVVQQLVALAAEFGRLDVVRFFLDLEGYYALDKNTMELAIFKAVDNNQWATLRILLTFKGSDLAALGLALAHAAKTGNLRGVKFIAELSEFDWRIKRTVIQGVLKIAGSIPDFSIEACLLLLTTIYPSTAEVTYENFSCLTLLLKNKEEFGVAVTHFFVKISSRLDFNQSMDLFRLIESHLAGWELNFDINSNKKDWINAFIHREQMNNKECKDYLGEVRLIIFNKWLDAVTNKKASLKEKQEVVNWFDYGAFCEIMEMKKPDVLDVGNIVLNKDSELFVAAVKYATRRNKDQNFLIREQVTELFSKLPQFTSHYTKAFNKTKQRLLLNASANIIENIHHLAPEDLLKELAKVLEIVLQPSTSTSSTTSSAQGVITLLNSREYSELSRFIATGIKAFQPGSITHEDLKQFISHQIQEPALDFSSTKAKQRMHKALGDELFKNSTCSDGQVLLAMDKTLAGLTISKGTVKQVNLILARQQFVEALINKDTTAMESAIADFRQAVNEHNGRGLLGTGMHFFLKPKSAKIFEENLPKVSTFRVVGA